MLKRKPPTNNPQSAANNPAVNLGGWLVTPTYSHCDSGGVGGCKNFVLRCLCELGPGVEKRSWPGGPSAALLPHPTAVTGTGYPTVTDKVRSYFHFGSPLLNYSSPDDRSGMGLDYGRDTPSGRDGSGRVQAFGGGIWCRARTVHTQCKD